MCVCELEILDLNLTSNSREWYSDNVRGSRDRN